MTKIKRKIYSIFILTCFLFSGLTANVAYAGMPVIDAVDNAWKITQDILSKVTELGKDVMKVSISQTLNEFAKNLAKNTVSGIASGDWGQEPLYFNLSVKDYLTNIVDQATGDLIDQLEKDMNIANLCAPLDANINYKFKLVLNILPSSGSNNVVTSASSCSFSEFVSNLKTSYSNVVRAVKNAIIEDCFEEYLPNYHNEASSKAIGGDYTEFYGGVMDSEMNSFANNLGNSLTNSATNLVASLSSATINPDVLKSTYLYTVSPDSIDGANASYFTKKNTYYRQKEPASGCVSSGIRFKQKEDGSYEKADDGNFGYLCTLAEKPNANNNQECITDKFIDFVNYKLNPVNTLSMLDFTSMTGGLVTGASIAFEVTRDIILEANEGIHKKIADAKTYEEFEDAVNNMLNEQYNWVVPIKVCNNDINRVCLTEAGCSDGAKCVNYKDLQLEEKDIHKKVCNNNYAAFCINDNQCGGGRCVDPLRGELGGTCLSYNIASKNDKGEYDYDKAKQRAFVNAYNSCYLKNIKDLLNSTIEVGEYDPNKPSVFWENESSSQVYKNYEAEYRQVCSVAVDMFVDSDESTVKETSFPELYYAYVRNDDVSRDVILGDKYKQILTAALVNDDKGFLYNALSTRLKIFQPFEQSAYRQHTGQKYDYIEEGQVYGYRKKKTELLMYSNPTTAKDSNAFYYNDNDDNGGCLVLPSASNKSPRRTICTKNINVEKKPLTYEEFKGKNKNKIEAVRNDLITACVENAKYDAESYRIAEIEKNRIALEKERQKQEEEIAKNTESFKEEYQAGSGSAKPATEKISKEVTTPSTQVNASLTQSLNMGTELLAPTGDPVVDAIKIFVSTFLSEASNSLLGGLFGRVFKQMDEENLDFTPPSLNGNTGEATDTENNEETTSKEENSNLLENGARCQHDGQCKSGYCSRDDTNGSAFTCKSKN